MKKSTATLLVSCFLLLSMLLFGYYNVTRPRILVLHSYDSEFVWTKGLDKTLRQGMKALHRPILSRWHYMNLRGAPGAQFTETAAASARRAIKDFEPHILVVFDDIAAELVTPELLNQPNIQIVFAGMDESLEHHGFDKADNTAGMLERIPVSALSDAVSHLGKGKPMTVACLGDARALSYAEARQLMEFDWSPNKLLPCELVATFSDWQAAVKRLEQQADMLFVSGYRGLQRSAENSEVVHPAEVATWTDTNSSMLTLAAKNTFVIDGGALAITPSPHEHGQAAAQLVGQLLDGVAPASIPVATGEAFIVSVNRDRLKRRGYEMPPVYEAAARAVGNLQ